MFSNSWGDGPIKTNPSQFDSSNRVWRSLELDMKADFCLAVTGVGSWQLMDLWPAFGFAFPPSYFFVLEYCPSMFTSWRSISLHQRPFYFVPAVASGTKVFVRQTAVFRTPRSLTWELRLIPITADLSRSWFILQVPCLSSRRQWILFPSRLLTCPALQVVMIYVYIYICIALTIMRMYAHACMPYDFQ